MARFGELFITPWLLSSALIAIMYVEHWQTALLYGLLSGVVFGVILASVSFLLTRFLKYSSWTFILVLVLMTIVGITTGVLIYSKLDSLPSTPWVMLQPPPPYKPVKLVGNPMNFRDGGSIIIMADNSEYYSYECRGKNSCKWKKLESIPVQPGNSGYGTCPIEFEPHYRTPKTPPGTVIDKYVLNRCGADVVLQDNWVVLEDGTIWHWSRFSSGIEILVYFLFGIVGGITGLLSSFVLLIDRNSKEAW